MQRDILRHLKIKSLKEDINKIFEKTVLDRRYNFSDVKEFYKAVADKNDHSIAEKNEIHSFTKRLIEFKN